MFGSDTSNNQTQTTISSNDTDTTNPTLAGNAPALSSTVPPVGLGDSPAPESVLTEDTANTSSSPDIPEFVPPDNDGNINKFSAPSPKPVDNLADIKKEALTKLGPLVDKLDQEPADKFKTLMMMIQASDDQSLISKAYDAANAIGDEKVKAQALLDVINEINYFTNQTTPEV